MIAMEKTVCYSPQEEGAHGVPGEGVPWGSTGIIRRYRDRGKLGARAFIGVSEGRNRLRSNFRRFWGIGAISDQLVPGWLGQEDREPNKGGRGECGLRIAWFAFGKYLWELANPGRVSPLRSARPQMSKHQNTEKKKAWLIQALGLGSGEGTQSCLCIFTTLELALCLPSFSR